MEYIIHTQVPVEDVEQEIRENLSEFTGLDIDGTFELTVISRLAPLVGLLDSQILEDIEGQVYRILREQIAQALDKEDAEPDGYYHVHTHKNATVYVLLFENPNTGEMEPSNFISPEKDWLLRPQDAPEGAAGFFFGAAHTAEMFKSRGLRVQISKWILDQDSVEDI